MTKPRKSRRPIVEEIEPRILYSADVPTGLLDAAPLASSVEQRTLDAGGEFAAASAAQTTTVAPQSSAHEIVFVDTAVPDYQKLIDDIKANAGQNRQIDVVLIQQGSDGIAQITKTLAGQHDVSAVHIISHGADGEVQLGDATLNFDSLIKNAAQIKGWSQALAPGADLLIYGCDVAEHADGKALVDALSRLTGADVAASEDLTGAADKGGNWTLEYHTGAVETGLCISLNEQRSYSAVLQSVAVGSETRANTTTSGTQESGTNNPPHVVAMDANGNYVVVWDGNGTQTGQSDGSGVFFQRYNASGVAQGAETRVNTTTTDIQNWPAVAMDANGNFVIAWTSANQDGSAGGIYAQRYNAAGVAQGGEFRVNTTTANDENAPAIAMSTNGFVIAWNDYGKDGSGNGVYAQRYNASGVAQGGEFRVNVTTAGDQWLDGAAMDANGNFIITWSNGDENTSPYQDVYMRRYNSSGTALTSEVRVNTTTTGDQNYSSVAMNASGAFVITWESSDGSNDGIYAQRYDSTGTAQGSEFRVNTTTANEQHLGMAGMDSNGNFVVVWSSYNQDAANTWGVYKQDYNADGTTNGSETRVNTTTAGDQVYPSIAMNGSGQYVVAWSGDGPGDSVTSYSTNITAGSGGTSVTINDAGGGMFFQRFSTALVVDTASDTVDGTTTSIAALLANKGADGKISLREAILAANNSANVGGPDRIYFNIASSGLQTINLTSALPSITGAVIIDGTTESGFTGMPLIELNGTSAGSGWVSGLTLASGSSGSTIKGLAINRFSGDGILVQSSNDVITGNFLGTDTSGTVARGNSMGLVLDTGSTNNRIGGTTSADRNIISGNTIDGIEIMGSTTVNNVVQGNYIGLDATGTVDLGNAGNGVAIFSAAANNTIGGTAAGAGNVISGNNGYGIGISAAGNTANVVQGNLIGTNAAGTAGIGNSKQGIYISAAAANTTVGGTAAGAANTIAYNTLGGVYLASNAGNGNSIRANSIYSNGGLGIDLGDNGVTANDTGDGDTGPNKVQNYPVLSGDDIVGGNITIGGKLNSAASSTFTIDFYASTSADPSGYGEGQRYLGSTTVSTNASGNVVFSATLAASVSAGEFITATATDSSGNTSEFSQAIGTDVLIVDTATDVSDGTATSIAALLANRGADGLISLREAIAATDGSANGSSPDQILFNIPGAGVQTINVASALPNITDAVVIDGTSQPGFSGTPLIALNGASISGSPSGLTLAAGSSGSTIRGFAIYGFGYAEIKISGSSNNLIAGNFLGTDASGTVAKGGWAGINIQSGSSNNIIGGTTAADRNIISGNTTDGVQIQDANTKNNVVEGNYIGLDVTGTLDLGNLQKGVALWGTASNNIIGGMLAGAGNVISGNNSLGVELSGAGTTGNIVEGNLIGTNAAGTAAVANSGAGISITTSAAGNTIGGTAAGAGNVISGNSGNGISITNSSNNELIEGNYIGLNAAGTSALANGSSGISVDSTSNNITIGGTVAGARNVISGNSSVGIWLNSTSGTIIQGNYVGLNAAGTAAVANSQQGITLNAGATLVTIGGTTAGARNVISGNGGNGININDGDSETIQGNYIGLNAAGTAAVANASAGIGLFLGSGGSQNNTIGGSAAGAGNVISGNTGNGINLQGASSTGNTFQGNLIGTDASGSAAIGNGQYGVQVNGPTSGTLIGGTLAGQGNVIANNGKAGVGVAGASAGALIEGNSIYANTNLGIDLNEDGVTGNDAGDADTGSNNKQNYPVLSGSSTTGSQITIAGSLNSNASRSYRIEFFASGSADATGYGEGQTYLGFTTVTTDASGNASFSPTLTAAVANGQYVSATATDLTTNDTSEFGLSLQVANHAPVLSGANNLTAINEDVTTSGGTLVSALLAGKVSDSDPNALSGIAVTAVDNTNGTWQYSTNGGGSWSNFGTPSAANSRLLSADASTYVRFVPNADWNGTVSGLTFRAWDQTTGTAGSTANTSSNGGSTAFSSATATASITVNPVNDAPVLSGANNLNAINEDPAANAGTLVSSLISGKVSDVDAGALSGIAVTAVDNSNGTWQYSTNGGGSWNAFSGLSNSSALLLKADASTYVRFVPNANFNGSVAGGITFRAWDQTSGSAGSTVDTTSNGGTTAFSTATASASISVNSVNDAPAGTDKTVTTLEDTVYTFAAADFGFSDVNDSPANNLLAVKISTLPGAGSLTDNGVTVSAGQFITLADISGGKLKFTPGANGNGAGYASFTFQVQDDGGTANGGVDLDQSPNTMTVNVTPVNDAPVGTSNTVTTNEDSAYTFAAVDFGFSDPNDSPANNLSAVKITTLPAAGSLTDNGVAVTSGQFITLADISGGKLKFTPVADANGAGYASFTFQVQDDGGSANGGVNLDPSARTMTINVTAVNDAPVLSGANNLNAINEDPVSNNGTLVSALISGKVSDVDSGSLSGIAVTAVDNSFGTWQYSTNGGGSWSAFSGLSDASALLLKADASTYVRFVPNANYNGSVAGGISFRAWDQSSGSAGSTADTTTNGGTSAFSSATASASIVVNSVNDAPQGANNTVTTLEDSAYTFASVDFGFSDVSDSPANSLLAVKISSLPAAGTLTDNGVTVSAGQFITAADISAGKLKFTPGANANGAGYAAFSFQVQDDGGTANGGVDLDASARTMSIDVTAVNDAPVNSVPGAQSTAFGSALTFSSGNGNAITVADVDAGAGSLRVTLTAVNGVVDLSQTSGLTFSIGSGSGDVTMTFDGMLSDINAALNAMSFTPDSGFSGAASLTIDTNDQGNSGAGGALSDSKSVSITVDAPTGVSVTNDGYATSEVSVLTVAPAASGVLGNDSDPLSGTMSVTSVNGNGAVIGTAFALPSGALLTMNADGTFSYDPNGMFQWLGQGATTSDTFTYHVDSDSGNSGSGSVVITVSGLNDAPVLSGANNLNTIDEDATGNSGTLVSTLLGGQLSDPDAGALAGIAVTAADTSNGSWEYSTNAGGSWSSFGGVSNANALLLAGDANTYVRFVPNANYDGSASISFRAWDQSSGAAGGTADTSSNGGNSAFSTAVQSASITISPVNDAPAGASNSVSLLEDGSYVFASADFGFSDVSDSPANTLLAVKITTLPGVGTLSDDGAAVTAGQYVSAADIAAGKLVFTPAANGNGAGYASFSFQVQDDGGSANGGVDTDPIARTMVIDVTAVNDAPSGADNTLSTLEDTPYTFAAADFGFSDVSDSPANTLLAVKISSLPGAGSLSDNGVALSAGDFVSVADIIGGKLKFTAAADANGAGYAAFSFQVQDDGGTLNGGVDLDPSANTITIDVTAVNDAPLLSGVNNLNSIDEDALANPGTLVSALIGGQVSDVDTGALSGIALTGVDNSNGVWQYSTNGGTSWNAVGSPSNGAALLLGADANTYLRFVPNANYNGSASVTLRAWDQSSGSVGSSADTSVNGAASAFSTATASASITVDSVNDAPQGANNSVTTLEDTAYTFAALDFGFSDPNDTPGNHLLGVSIATLPAAGTLTDNGVTVSAGQFVSVADISAGKLQFTPVANANGAGYASFTFQVQDDGGSANGGVDTDAIARTMTIDVTPVNDAPTSADATLSTAESSALVFNLAEFSFSDVDLGDSLQSVTITSLSGAGSLTLSGVAVSAGQIVSAANIAAGNLVFTPVAGANGAGYAAFGFTVSDGTLSSAPANTLTIDVTSINDAPQGADHTVSMLEDSVYTFAVADFGFSDVNDTPANALQAVEITTLPGAGTLSDNGVALTAGQFVSVVDIIGGKLKFTPAANANGAAYAAFSFQVQDDGGTAGGGVDVDPIARTMSIDVTAVNDAPQGADNTVSTLEDTAYVFSTGDFGFADAADTPANTLQGVQIVALPAAGSLTDNGAAVSAGQLIGVADISGGKLQFLPSANANGAAYAAFSFKVQDDGGSANGGANTDLTARTMTIDVTAVNDAPVLGNHALSITQGGSLILTTAQLSASDVDNASAGLSFSVSNVINARFELVSAAGVAITTFTQADISAGLVRLVDTGAAALPAFDVSVSDGTLSAGPLAASVSFSLTPPAAVTAMPLPPLVSATAPAAQPSAPQPSAPDSGSTAPASGDAAGGLKPAAKPVIVLSGGRVAAPEPIGFELPQSARASTPLRSEPDRRPNPAPILHSQDLVLSIPAGEIAPLESSAPTVPDWSAQTAFPDTDHDATHDQMKILMESVRMGGIALSVGVVWWASRVGGLIGSLLASMPAWRHLDPLPIVGRDDDEDEQWTGSEDAEADADELAVSMVFEQTRAAMPAA